MSTPYNSPSTRSLLPRGKDDADRFYLSRITLNNWGTFQNINDFPIARKGFVFAGPSGSGKSTALDAHATLMTSPKWLDYNVAARTEKGHDRTLMSYVRGAWGNKTGQTLEVTRQYLRPDSTWSAISESYRNDLGRVITLVQVFWIKGASCSAQDMNKRYFVFDLKDDFELSELKEYAESGFKKVVADRLWPNTPCIDTFDRYQEVFRPLLGIQSEATLRLLHKTQSTKDMGELNKFLRDFMLEEPRTYEVATAMTEKFHELNAAHEAVLEAEEQIGVLTPVRSSYREHQEGLKTLQNLNETIDSLDVFVVKLKKELLEKSASQARQDIEGHDLKVKSSDVLYTQAREHLNALLYQKGGIENGEIQRLEHSIAENQEKQNKRTKRMYAFQKACQALELNDENSADNFISIKALSAEKVISIEKLITDTKVLRDKLVGQRTALEKEIAEIVAEISSMQKQRSNLPGNFVDMRAKLAKDLGLNIDRLPFGGELIQVKESEAAWQGAIERLLGGFGRTLLAMPGDVKQVTRWINDHHTGMRVTVQAMNPQISGNPLSSRAAAHKLEFAEGMHNEWIRENIKMIAGHDCVESEHELHTVGKGMTREGLIKESHTRFIKDDRSNIHDRRNWVLGFSNEAKKKEYEDRGYGLSMENETIKKEVAKCDVIDGNQRSLIAHCRTLEEMQWDDIDVQTPLDQLRLDRARHAEIQENDTDMQALDEKIVHAKTAEVKAGEDHTQKRTDLKGAENSLVRIEASIAKLNPEKLSMDIVPFVNEQLQNRFETETQKRHAEQGITQDNLEIIARSVNTRLSDDRSDARDKQKSCEVTVVRGITKFIETWRNQTEGLDASLSSAEEFIGKLTLLEEDNLPKFKDRFEKMLRDQSDQHLTSLSSQIKSELRSIHERIEQVNDALSKTEFNKGTRLSIEPRDKSLPEVIEFKDTVRSILEMSLGADRTSDDLRFKKLKGLIARFASKDPKDERWKTLVLDVREHNEFLAREKDASGLEVQTYSGSSGKSGGERQKLTMTILAAALRYQLGGEDGEFSSYSTITVDEAFEKADSDFTKTTMRIFESCGFQMVAATPLKAVIALDEFVGGAVYIHMGANHVSQRKCIDYDEEKQRLILSKELAIQLQAADEALALAQE